MPQVEKCVKAKVKKWVTKKFVTGRKMCHIWKNGSQLEKRPQLRKCGTAR